MKTKFRIQFIYVVCLNLSGILLYGHDIAVHQAVTLNAHQSASRNSTAYAGFIGIITNDAHLSDVINNLKRGSRYEDNNGWFEDSGDVDVGGKRSLNHFYDPLTGLGLSETPAESPATVGRDSFTWSSVSNCAGINFPGVTWFGFGKNVSTSNIWSWENARGYEWLGLTAASQSDRKTHILNMFQAIGQVMHLLEDASQPQHVRNEQHLDKIIGFNTPWRSPIEDWGNANVPNLNFGDGSMLDWRGAGFTKLEDFWNRHLYAGDFAVLAAAENSSAQLGLAEWCNGNFLGDRHSYAEYYQSPDIRFYPNPTLANTDFRAKLASASIPVQVSYLKNGKSVNRIYINKTGGGVKVSDHSVLNYLGVYSKTRGHFTSVSTSIRDDNVLSNYHNVFIPKAVKYGAGMLDYFFRGQLALTITRNIGQDDDYFTINAQNVSGQTLSGGTFFLYKEDDAHNRTLLSQTNLIGALSEGNNETLVVPSETLMSTNTSFFLIYQGTIGVANGTGSDPMDAGISIAVNKFGVFANNEFIHVGCDRLSDGDVFNYHTVPASTAYSPISEADAEHLADGVYAEFYPYECF